MTAWIEPKLLLRAHGQTDWLRSHSGATCIEEISTSEIRLLLTGRDSRNRSHIGRLTLDRHSLEVKGYSKNAVLDLGPSGSLDETGTSYPEVFRVNGRSYLHYTGWSLGADVPFYNHLFRAMRDESGNYKRTQALPISVQDDLTSIGIGATMISAHPSGKLRLYYAAFKPWIEGAHSYCLESALSEDGLHWTYEGCAIDAIPGRENISRPTYLGGRTSQRIWFCHRPKNGNYSIGYAEGEGESPKLKVRAENIFSDVSLPAWCNAGQCYPTVIQIDGRIILFFAGNDYGKAGIGYSVYKDEP